MPDDAPLPDPSGDEFCLRYLVTCAALSVKPVGVERARELIAEWSDANRLANQADDKALTTKRGLLPALRDSTR